MAVTLVACGGDDSSNGGGGGSKTLISSSSVPADSTCPNGGTKLSVGTDTNGNGTLDPDEITGSQEICNGAPSTLTTVTPTGADAKCKDGGVIVQSGADTNGNGKLDASEVTQTQEICNGSGSTAVLSKTSPVAAGDPNCPLGGTETQSGPDNGTGGGTADDGILQSGEVTSTTFACVSVSGTYVGSFSPPPALSPQPAYVIDVHGGAGSSSTGGFGGGVTIAKAPTNGGHLKVFKTGKADASFTMPGYAPVFGTKELDVTADTTLQVRADGTTAADGDYYFVAPNSLFFRENSGNNAVAVTGLHVAAGKTFTIPATITGINLVNDIAIDGTVAATVTSGNAQPITITTPGVFIGGAGGTITTAGQPVANAAGGAGAPISIMAGMILNQAKLDASGADGGASGVDDGGAAGGISLQQSSITAGLGGLFNSGTILANGGKGTGGGNGGSVTGSVALSCASKGVFNSGAVTADGGAGSGTTGNGGSASGFTVSSNGGGFHSSGAIHISGGDASSACTGTCTGGTVFALAINALGGDLVIANDIVANGGKSVGTTGATAAGLFVTLGDFSSPFTGSVPSGNVFWSGNVSLIGGSGTSGGMGGSFNLTTNTNTAHGQEIVFLGYTDIKAYGGDGDGGGGNSLGVSLAQTAGGIIIIPIPGGSSGAVINYANIDTHGGKALTTGGGGTGGAIQMSTGTGGFFPPAANDAQVIYNAGNLDAHAGDGVTPGGPGGPISLTALERVDDTGTCNVSGGSSAGGGSPGGPVVVQATAGPVAISGAMTTTGGSGTGAGNAGQVGGPINVTGTSVTITSALTTAGGNSNGVAGANGGPIALASTASFTSATGAINTTGGTGTPNGNKGNYTVDGVLH